jgi:hypothetical protein
MNTNQGHEKGQRLITKRGWGWASLAGVVGCGIACSIPLLAAAGVGGGATAALAHLLWPGAEFVLGGLAFAGALGVQLWRRHARLAGAACAITPRRDAGEVRSR